MYKNIYVDADTAAKFGNTILINSKGVEFTSEQISEHNKLHKLCTMSFRDVNGNAYIIVHGISFEIDSNNYGYLNYEGNPKSASFVYEKLIESGFLKDNETLNVICCHGKTVKEYNNKMARRGEVKSHPINFVNDTAAIAYVTAVKLKNGNVRLAIGTMENILERVLYKIKAFS